MPLTTAQQVRLKVSDPPYLREHILVGDGLASSFLLPHRTIHTASASAFVSVGGTAWSATGATFNASGQVSFNTASIPSASAVRVTYPESVFSDDEIDHFITAGGSVNGAARQALHTLFFDAAKRARWMSPDGSQYDDLQSIPALYRAYSALLEEEQLLGASTTEFQSWAENQEWY